MKFSCSYDEADTFGDSCGSAEEGSEEGSDSEFDPNVSSQLIDITAVKGENEESDFDVEVIVAILRVL